MKSKTPHLLPILAAMALASGIGCASATEGESSADAVAACEEKTARFLRSDYLSDPTVATSLFTPEFAVLWITACNPPEGETIYWGADPILETQDMEPKLLGIDPGEVDGGAVRVPVRFQHEGQAPYRKIFVFEQRQGRWLVADILTDGVINPSTGERATMASEFQQLQRDLPD
jgi:hypothetical protein